LVPPCRDHTTSAFLNDCDFKQIIPADARFFGKERSGQLNRFEREKGLDDHRVELDAGIFGEVAAGAFGGAGVAARTVVGQGGVRISYAKDAGADRYLRPPRRSG